MQSLNANSLTGEFICHISEDRVIHVTNDNIPLSPLTTQHGNMFPLNSASNHINKLSQLNKPVGDVLCILKEKELPHGRAYKVMFRSDSEAQWVTREDLVDEGYLDLIYAYEKVHLQACDNDIGLCSNGEANCEDSSLCDTECIVTLLKPLPQLHRLPLIKSMRSSSNGDDICDTYSYGLHAHGNIIGRTTKRRFEASAPKGTHKKNCASRMPTKTSQYIYTGSYRYSVHTKYKSRLQPNPPPTHNKTLNGMNGLSLSDTNTDVRIRKQYTKTKQRKTSK